MSQDEFTDLFAYVSQRLDETDHRLAGLHDQLEDIGGLLDAFLAKADLDDTDRAILGHQVGRREKWLSRASEKLGVSYDPAG